jgi:hypothetical protein
MVVAFDEAQNTDSQYVKRMRKFQNFSLEHKLLQTQFTEITQMSILPNNYGEQQCTLPFLATLAMNSSAYFLVISGK